MTRRSDIEVKRPKLIGTPGYIPGYYWGGPDRRVLFNARGEQVAHWTALPTKEPGA